MWLITLQQIDQSRILTNVKLFYNFVAVQSYIPPAFAKSLRREILEKYAVFLVIRGRSCQKETIEKSLLDLSFFIRVQYVHS